MMMNMIMVVEMINIMIIGEMMMMVISGPAVHQPHEKMHAYTSNPLDCQKNICCPGPP